MTAAALPHASADARSDVDWRSYAAVYDVMAAHNPAYQDIVDRYRRFLAPLRLRSGDTLLEVGAGTGNFSLEAARAWPQCHVVHVDASDAMNAHARRKRAAQGLGNVEIRTADVDAFDVPDGSVALVTIVHALYAFPDPPAVLARCHRWLKPGGAIFACDPGAPPDVGDWARYIFRSTSRSQGILPAVRLFWRARGALRENRRIGQSFDAGTFWRHDAATFRAAFEAAGFEVAETDTVYRGASDLVVAQKPLGAPPAFRTGDPYHAAI